MNGKVMTMEELSARLSLLESHAKTMAFPSQIPIDPCGYQLVPGLTKREWFAGMAFNAASELAISVAKLRADTGVAGNLALNPATLAAMAVEYADALIAKLERTK